MERAVDGRGRREQSGQSLEQGVAGDEGDDRQVVLDAQPGSQAYARGVALTGMEAIEVDAVLDEDQALR